MPAMKTSMRRQFSSLGFWLLALVSVPALPQSQPGSYTIEILVFRSGGNPGDEDLATKTVPKNGTASSGGVRATLASQRRLADAADRLRAVSGYKVIAHTAWTQAPAAWNSRKGVSAAQLGLSNAGLTGNVILERGQYLHLGFDLHYVDSGTDYSLLQVRRVKVNERQYFDHPAIGVIALVSAGE
jgi:Peptidoglycan-binding protein, CsiV